MRAVVEEVVKGRDIRRDQILAWEDRIEEASLEIWGGGPPYYQDDIPRLATVSADGQSVRSWMPLEFYRHNLRTCYRRSMVSPAG